MSRLPAILTTAILVGTLLPTAAHAQDVKYTTVSEVEFGGTLGVLMNFVPGGDTTTEETTYIKDSWVRTDSEASSVVVDYATGTIMQEDHEERTYYTLTFEQMMTALGKGVQGDQDVESDEPTDATDNQDDSAEMEEMNFRFNLSTDGSGDRANVGGYDALQTVLTMEVEAEATTDDGDAVLVGDMTLISDQWTSEEFPGQVAMRRLYEEYGDQMRAVGARADEASGITAAFEHDPRLKVAMERSGEELAAVGGPPVKSTTYFLLVPAGAEWDRDEVLAMEGRPISEGLGSVMGRAARDVAASSARDAVRSRFGGFFGGGGDDQEEEEDPAADDPQASLIARVTMTVKDAEETMLGLGVFQPRDGYREEMPEYLRGLIER